MYRKFGADIDANTQYVEELEQELESELNSTSMSPVKAVQLQLQIANLKTVIVGLETLRTELFPNGIGE